MRPIRWNIFAGLLFSVAGMCLLNYYSLFPSVESEDNEDSVVVVEENKQNNK